MINYRVAARSNRSKSIFTAVILSVLISACSSSGSDNPSPQPGPDVTENSQNISALTNTPGVDGWVCALGDGTFGAYLFYADLTGRFDYLANNGDGTYNVVRIDEFTYTTTSANSLEILYEYDDGTSQAEVITNIAFSADAEGFTALSDLEGSLTCGRSRLTSAESGDRTIPFGVYF